MPISHDRDLSSDELNRMLAAIWGPDPDPLVGDPQLLAKILNAINTTDSLDQIRTQYPDLWVQIEQDPSLRDTFDLFFELETSVFGQDAPQSSMVQRTADLFRTAIEEGRQWFVDAVGSVAIVLAPGPNLATDSIAMKSHASATPGQDILHQVSVGGGEIGDWDIVTTVLAEDVERCRVEISIFNNDLIVEIAGRRVVLRTESTDRSAVTNENGVVIFDGVSQALLSDTSIHLDLGA